MTPSNFQVDLGGLLSLLSQHLYSTPAVYLRELLQNGVDALTARAELGGDQPSPRVEIRTPSATGSGRLEVRDNGIGLTAEEMVSLLATIGRSSKRDDFDFARTEFLGQFGIGLLSAFLATDRIEVRSRSARTLDASTVVWLASKDGTYTLRDAEPHEALDEPGTLVVLAAENVDRLTQDDFVLDTVRGDGELLTPEVVVVTADGPTRINTTPVWELDEDAAASWCAEHFGFTPLAHIPLQVEVAQVRGVVFVCDSAQAPGANPGHRAYLKGMLLGDQVRDLLPDWCFFVRGVFDVAGLRPTASREALFADETLDDVADALGNGIIGWLLHTASADPRLMGRLMAVHQSQIVSMALHSEELLDVAAAWVRFETTDGDLTIQEFRDRHDQVRFAATNDQFRGLSAIAAAQNLGVINAGHTDELPLLERLAERQGFVLEAVDPAGLALSLTPLSQDDQNRAAALLEAVRDKLAGRELDMMIRSFSPSEVPSVYLPDPEVHARNLVRRAKDLHGLFGDLMSAYEEAEESRAPAYVLNARNTLVDALIQLANNGDVELAAEVGAGLYAQALLAGRHPMDQADQTLLATTFMQLINRVLAA